MAVTISSTRRTYNDYNLPGNLNLAKTKYERASCF